MPIIVRKSDGGYTYGTTDLAATRYWTRDRDAADLLYVIGAPQRQHLAMVSRHPLTRGGPTSITGSASRVRDRRGEVRRPVQRTRQGLRVRLDRMLPWRAHLGVPALRHARIRSILRRADAAGARAGSTITVHEPAEPALAVTLLRLLAAVAATDRGHAPHTLCVYLYELATAFSGFYENCPILADTTTDEERASRLALATLTSRALVLGLDLLGIDAPDKL